MGGRGSGRASKPPCEACKLEAADPVFTAPLRLHECEKGKRPPVWTWGIDLEELRLLRDLRKMIEASTRDCGEWGKISDVLAELRHLDTIRPDLELARSYLTEEHRGPWITTFTGRAFHLLDPRPEDFDIVDTAHSLARVCRWGGHVANTYSVGQHCVIMSYKVPPQDALDALLHENEEPYLGDVSAPLKAILGARFKEVLVYPIQRASAKRFNTRFPAPPSVKHEDLRALATERRDFMPEHAPGGHEYARLELVSPYPETLRPWSAEEAKATFLERFDELGGVR